MIIGKLLSHLIMWSITLFIKPDGKVKREITREDLDVPTYIGTYMYTHNISFYNEILLNIEYYSRFEQFMWKKLGEPIK